MIKFTSYQKLALDFFDKNNYVIIDSPRQMGKTTVLKEIIRKNKDKIIVVITPNRYIFDQYTREFPRKMKNGTLIYMRQDDEDKDIITYFNANVKTILSGQKIDIVIGDEVQINPNAFLKHRIKVASASTQRDFFIHRWRSEWLGQERLKQLKDRLGEGEKFFELEYGQYILEIW